jgi:outer membrane protein OmpA-like peptidoglycan-associated protein
MFYLIRVTFFLLFSTSFLVASTSATNQAKEMAINNSTANDKPKEAPKKETAKVAKTEKKPQKTVKKVLVAKPVEIKQTVDLNISDKPIFYPQPNPAPLQVGEEDYQKSYLALAGLTGVYVNIDDVLKGATGKEVQMLVNLKAEVVKRLNSAGIRLLTEDEMEKTPGQPQMSMFPSFPKHLGKPKKGEPAIIYRADCCTMGIWTSFLQGGKVLRNPLINYKLGTWGQGHNTNDCSDIGGWMSDVILQTIDSFVEDKLKADTDYKEWFLTQKRESETVEEVKKVDEVNSTQETTEVATTPALNKEVKKPLIEQTMNIGEETCSANLMMYIEMFKTDSSFIIPSKRYILKKLANVMKSCPDYNYLIETHADARASKEYNRKLTEKRAKSIRFYLLSQGVRDAQFDIQPFGESEPVVDGETQEDHVANRRVVVTPFRVR